MNNIIDFCCGNLNSKQAEFKKINIEEPCPFCEYYKICGGRCLYSNKAKLWPKQGQKLICKTIIHLIKTIEKKIPEIKDLIKEGKIKEKDFEYEKYFGPEIIP
jgi:sulfatase maturation enzyme AslB (radical SAM superfamily)